jgi:hypothetical protein
MPFLDVVKSILNLEPPKPSLALITVNGADELHELPRGFFNVETASGKKSLGYNGATFYCFDVGETVVDDKRITLDKPRSELPTVKLDYRGQGSNVVGGHSIIETDTFDSGETVSWSGMPPSGGVQLR